jgi:arylsulfatase A-like enzyme
VASDLITEAGGYARGFNSFAHVPYANARQVEDLAEAFLVDHAQQQFFLFLHEFDPHSPYAAPEPFRDRYVPEELRGRTVAQVEARLQVVTEGIQLRGEAPPGPDDPDLRWYRGRYLGEIAWWDSQLGHLLEALKRLKLDDSTIVVLVADHGEEFFEHGLFGHGSNLFDETLHVPLLVAAPPAGWSSALPFGVRDDVVETEALHASVLEWLGAAFDADVVRPSLRHPTGMAFSETDKGLVLDAFGDPFRRSMDSVRTAAQRAIVSLPVEGEPRDAVKREVYDLRADPAARVPLPDSPVVHQAIQQVLDTASWCEAHRAAQAPAGLSPDQMATLQALGYTGPRSGRQAAPPSPQAPKPPH